MGRLKSQGKSFEISKWEVWEAFRQVKANQGAAGVDGQSVADFEADLKNNLFKIWNRMSSGSYFPPAVRAVEIPKQHGGGTRMLGIPTVADRVAQTVVARHLGVRVEPVFREDSYGYRPGRSALDAVAGLPGSLLEARLGDRSGHPEVLRQRPVGPDRQGCGGAHRCPVGGAVCQAVAGRPAAPARRDPAERDRGTPQGSAVSPVLANLFMHYAFDAWLAREYPGVWFERYADDAVVHCVTERQAREVLAALGDRMEQVGLRLHPAKTKIVYCKDSRGAPRTSTPRSRSWGSRSGHARRGARTAACTPGSCPRSARTP